MRNFTTKAIDPLRNWDQTTAARVIPGSTALHLKLFPQKFYKCSSFRVLNGEDCGIGEWVIAKSNDNHHYVAKVIEILQISGSEAEVLQQPSFVLVLLHSASYEVDEYYRMPKLTNLGVHELLTFEVCGH